MLLRLSSLPRHKYVHDFQNFNRNFPLYKPPVKKTDTDLRAFKYAFLFLNNLEFNKRIIIIF